MAIEIRVQNLGKSFIGDGITTNALHNINAGFEKGQLISIVGSSGSGKSTLLSLIGTLDRPTHGSIFFGDQDISKLRGDQLADFRFHHIGFIFQQFHLLPTLSALENVTAPLFGRKVSFHKDKRAKELLEKVGLQAKINSLPSQLSGGQQQRVAIARALINEPEWLLADEPTGNLDSETGELVYQLLNSLKEEKGCGILLVTHDPELARKADRMVEMKDGIIISDTAGVR
jgi:putative ABC transport system ATP-binding protein